MPRLKRLLHERHAHPIGVDRGKLLGPPGLRLQRSIGMHRAATTLKFLVHGLNAFYSDPHHGLVADRSCEHLIAHAGNVQVSVAAIDSCVVRRRSIAKRFLEPADVSPPTQRFRRISSGQNWNCTLDDRFHCRSIDDSSWIRHAANPRSSTQAKESNNSVRTHLWTMEHGLPWSA